jgi:hypothetical protein
MASKILKLNTLLVVLGLISSINSKSVTYQQTLSKPGLSSSEHQVLFRKVYAATVPPCGHPNSIGRNHQQLPNKLLPE